MLLSFLCPCDGATSQTCSRCPVCTIMPGRVQHAIHEREGERQERRRCSCLTGSFALCLWNLMELIFPWFWDVLGVSLSFLRPTCRLSSALQGTTASVVQQCAASQAPEVECDITPHCDIVCPSWILVEGHKMWPWLRPTYWHKAANREFVSSTCKLFWTFLKMLKVFESHSSVYWGYCTDKSFWSFFQAHPSPTYTCWLSKVDTGSWITEVTCSGCKVCGKHIDPHFDIARTACKDSIRTA